MGKVDCSLFLATYIYTNFVPHTKFFYSPQSTVGFPGGSVVKNPPANAEIQVRSLGRKDPMEKETATHSSILTWRMQWTEEPGGLQSVGSQKSAHD